MKKVLFGLIIFLLIPFSVNGATITNMNITGTDSVNVKDKFSLTFNMDFSGISKEVNGEGIVSIIYQVMFDDSVFEITNASSNDPAFDIDFYLEDGVYFVTSVVNENGASNNRCVDNYLYCSSYSSTVEFSVKDTDKSVSSITMGAVVLGTLTVIPSAEYVEDDIKISTIISTKNKRITINKLKTNNNDNQVAKNKLNDSQTNNNQVNNDNKSSNNYLKSLEIKGYKIDFDKDIKYYEIDLKKKDNSLNIEVSLEDENSTYEIIGNENLKKNNYKVLINVTSQDGNKRTYTIDAKKEKSNKTKKIKIDKKYLIIGGIVIGIIMIIALIIHIISNRKIDKALKDL